MTSPNENQLIKEAYAATLDPSRLAQFEKFWETYIDTRSQRSPKEFDQDDININTHITLAIEILERIRFQNKKSELAQQLVDDHYGFGFILDGDGRIIAKNSNAKTFIEHALNFRDLSLDQGSLDKVMRVVSSSSVSESKEVNFFHVHLSNEDRTTCWFLAPVKLLREVNNEGQSYFIITSVDSNINAEAQSTIGKFLGLTPAETHVVGLLSTGHTPKEITAIRNVKITATRAQIVNIKSKMRAKDIPDIVRMFLSMGLRYQSVRGKINRMETLHSKTHSVSREASMTLRDGRTYQYFEQGDINGRVILQIHSLISGVEFPQETTELLKNSGYRMISPARAGYGGSDENPKRDSEEVINSAVQDIIELLDHIGVDDVIVLTGWGGAIAQKLAIKDVKRIRGIVLSGAVPVWQSEYINQLGPRYRSVIKASIYAPKAVPLFIRIAKALIDSGQSRIFIDGLDTVNETDRLALRYDEIYVSIERRFKFLVKQGVLAFTQDLPSIHSDWTQDAGNVTQPVIVLMGEKNNDQPKSAFKRYIDVAPHASLVVIEGAGTYQNLTHFTDVLHAIKTIQTP